MADSRSYPKSPSLNRQNQSNVTSQVTHILFKSLVFLLFLIAIPLFPSQAPEFINHGLLIKFWELLRLLFIGLAVCYGLFSRRNADSEFESTHSNSFDDSQSSSFVSRIFHVTPIFEDGSEIQSVSDDKNVYQNWNSQFYKGDSRFTVPVDNNGSKTVTDEQIKNGFFQGSENRSEISLEQDENSVVQAWSSQYFQGESVVVVSQANYASDQWGKPPIGGGFQPLGLPVRSLNSRIENPNGSYQFSNGSQSDSSLIGSSNCSPKSMAEEENFGDQGQVNLEEKLNENSFLHSQDPWLSRSGRPELRERVVPLSNRSHFRPLSVDETQFESFKSQSFRSNASLASQTSSMSTSPDMLSPSHTSCSESPNSGTEEPVKMKEREATLSPLATQSPQAAKTCEAKLNAFHLRRYSSGSLFQKDTQKRAKDDSKNPSHKRREDGQGSLKPDKKSTNIVKASSRGKSVRTIRSSAYTPEAKKASKIHMDGNVGKGYDVDAAKNEVSTGFSKKNDNVGKGYDVDVAKNEASSGFSKKNDNVGKGYDVDVAKNEVSSGFSKKNVDSRYKMPKPTFAEYQKSEKKEALEKVNTESEQESEIEIDNFQVRLDNGAPISFTSDFGHDPDEVDKKAGEFIAKFREQIRLQKVASVERSKGLRMSGKYLR